MGSTSYNFCKEKQFPSGKSQKQRKNQHPLKTALAALSLCIIQIA
jgi:hypothetical protein